MRIPSRAVSFGRGTMRTSVASRVERSVPELDGLRLRIDDLLHGAQTALTHGVELSRVRIAGLESALMPLSPENTLRRGYAIVSARSSDGILTDNRDVSAGDILDITLHRGKIVASVESKSSDTEHS